MHTNPHAKFIVDSKGRRTAVILTIKDYEEMVRELNDLRDAQFVDEAEATATGFTSLEDLKRTRSRRAS